MVEHIRRFSVALAQARKTSTTVEIQDIDNQGDVFLVIRPGDEHEANVYMSKADAILFATQLLEAAHAGK